MSRFSISTVLVQTKSSSGKKIPTSFPWEPSYFIYLNNQATLPCHFNFHIFSLCVLVLWFSEISSLQPTAINYCPEQSSLSNSISNKMKKRKSQMRKWTTTNPEGPILTRSASYFASPSKPELRGGAITCLVAERESVNKNKTSLEGHWSVNVNHWFGWNILLDLKSDFQMKYKQLKFYCLNKWGHRLPHIWWNYCC